ncbi:hypothetical protein, partial [Noviherbaspirillum sp. ST9]|uniref:hypothetical protein n=1 Tax=Noviherbaspirillum sp. ST9 TaxID=3401606 RepID=UPI003B588B01
MPLVVIETSEEGETLHATAVPAGRLFNVYVLLVQKNEAPDIILLEAFEPMSCSFFGNSFWKR